MSTAVRPDLLWRDLKPRRDAARRKLAAVRRSIRGCLALFGTAWTLAAVLAVAVVTLILDLVLRLGVEVRLALGVAAAGAIGYVAYRWLLKPMQVKLDDLDLAALLDKRQPGVGLHLSNVLQLPDLIEGAVQASPTLVHAAVVEHAREVEHADLKSTLNTGLRRGVSWGMAVGMVAVAAVVMSNPAAASLWAKRWLLASRERWPQNTYLSVAGLGDRAELLVPRGEPFLLDIYVFPEYETAGDGLRLLHRGDDKVALADRATLRRLVAPDAVSIRLRRGDGNMQYETRKVLDEADVQFDMPPLAEAATITIYGGDDWLGPIAIRPVDRPSVARHELWFRGPGDADWRPGSEDDPRFLRDSEIQLRVYTSVPVEQATLAAKQGDTPAFSLDATDPPMWLAQWKLKESQTFEIGLVGGEGNLESKPHLVNVGLRDDAKPKVTVRYSGVGKKVTPQATVPLAVRAVDDYGVQSLTVQVDRIVQAGDAPSVKTDNVQVALPETEQAVLDFESQQRLSLKNYEVTPGTQVKIKALAVDKCARGPQTGESRVLTFQVVAPDELFYEILGRQRVERAKFVGAIASAKTQVSDLAVLVSAEQGTNVGRKHQVIARQVWQVANRLDAILQELTLNELGSPKDRQIQEKIIESLRRLYEERLADLAAKIGEVATDPENAGDKLIEARTLQQEAVAEMEKILAQMQFWESFVDVVNQLNQVIKMESGVQEATQKESKSRTETIFDEDEQPAPDKPTDPNQPDKPAPPADAGKPATPDQPPAPKDQEKSATDGTKPPAAETN